MFQNESDLGSQDINSTSQLTCITGEKKNAVTAFIQKLGFVRNVLIILFTYCNGHA